MVKFYVNMILNGRMTLDQVPARWYEAVREELERIDAERKAQEVVQPEEEPIVEETAAEPESEHDEGPAEEQPAEQEEQEEEPSSDPVDEYEVGHDDILDDEEEE